MVDPIPPPKKPSYKEHLKRMFAEWGALVLWVYFGIFGVVLFGFVLAIKFGFGVESTAGELGTLGAAYLATKLTQPLRIAATLVLTPALAALIRRFRKRTGESPPPPAAPLDKASPDSR